MLGVYNGDPAGAHCTGNPQVCDDNGLDFQFNSPPLLMAEGSYKYNQEGHLPGTIKIGGWNQFGTLHNQPFGSGSPTVAVTFNSVPLRATGRSTASLTSLFGAYREQGSKGHWSVRPSDRSADGAEPWLISMPMAASPSAV